MDFNTGGSGGQNPNDPSRPMFGEESPRPGRGPTGGAGNEFNLSDPVGSFVRAFAGVLLRPAGFYRGIARSGDYVAPLIFGAICSALSGLLAASVVAYYMLVNGAGWLAIFYLAVAFLYGMIGGVAIMFLGAGIVHLLVRAYVRPNAGFEATFRVMAYASVAQLLAWIPLVNVLIGGYVLFLGVVGVREVHSTTTGRAVRCFLLFILLYALVVVGIFASIFIPILLGR